jgi:hypothetical protein
MHAPDMIPERAPDMMVLAMDVIGNSSTHSQHLGSWRHRKHPSSWNQESLNITELDPRLDEKTSGFWVKLAEMVQGACNPEIATLI